MTTSTIPRRTLGRTGLEVGVLGYGAMELRGEGHNDGRAVSPAQVAAVLDTALDNGIDLVDTSPDYGGSEEAIGAAIGRRRDEYVLASKCGCPFDAPPDAPRPLRHDYTRANIVAVVERSLTRLRTDRLDLLQLHISPPREVLDRDDVIATLKDLQQQGKVRFLGCSSTLPNLVDHLDLGVFDAIQLPYSALERSHEGVMHDVAAAGAGVIVRGGVARGDPSVGRGSASTWATWTAAGLDDLRDGDTPTQFMLRFTLAHPALTSTIVGTLDPVHLTDNVATAARGPLPADVYAEALRRLDDAAPH